MKNLDVQLAKSKYLKKQYIYKKNNQKLVYKFNLSENIERNYSQMLQDIFVLTVLNGKSTGTYVEIGSSHQNVLTILFYLKMFTIGKVLDMKSMNISAIHTTILEKISVSYKTL